MYLPIIGILIFMALYIFAASLYPGGSQADLYSVGFDWMNNYWCNLMNEVAMNGEINPARPYAIVAMIILCLSLALFFILFAQTFVKHIIWKRIIQWFGVLSMIAAIFIFSAYHDLMTIISSLLGFWAVIGIIRSIYKSSLTGYKITGAICIVLLIINNYIYYSHHFLALLPLIQKITFAIVLVWIMGLNFKLIKWKYPL